MAEQLAPLLGFGELLRGGVGTLDAVGNYRECPRDDDVTSYITNLLQLIGGLFVRRQGSLEVPVERLFLILGADVIGMQIHWIRLDKTPQIVLARAIE